jgi:mannose-6-phosphate isomerase
MSNIIQDYAWGSRTAISTIFGIENSTGEPQAEIWMGAHPNGCSKIIEDNVERTLSSLIANAPTAILGESTAKAFGELPFLLKVLAAEKALSVQVHPSKQQAETGFELESSRGLNISDPTRNFKDPNHKPELVYALTTYQALNGFRPFEEILALFEPLANSAIGELVSSFRKNCSPQGLQQLFATLLSLRGEQKRFAIASLIEHAKRNADDNTFKLVLELESQFPGDIGLFSPLLLNVIVLEPGQAMFLHACTPHAYIHGTAIEIMANSDNVLRAGLTPKHVDVNELVACTVFSPVSRDTILTTPVIDGEAMHFPVPVTDFKFSVYSPIELTTVAISSAEILFAIDASLTVRKESGQSITINKGESIFVPASTQVYSLHSTGRVARAYC